MVEPGIEPGTSWLVVRSSDHQTKRLVKKLIETAEGKEDIILSSKLTR
jgi:hypothetical protein